MTVCYCVRGDGMNAISMQSEWATIKKGVLYIGTCGYGVESPWNSPGGRTLVMTNENSVQGNLTKHERLKIVHKHGKLRGRRLDTSLSLNTPQWIATIDPSGRVNHVDWTAEYLALEESANMVSTPRTGHKPGLSHEAVLWSDKLDVWIFLPSVVDVKTKATTAGQTGSETKLSDRLLNSEAPEGPAQSSVSSSEPITASHGDVLLLKSSPDFQTISVVKVDVNAIVRSASPAFPASLRPETAAFHFSSAKFLPESGDRIIVAVLTAQSIGLASGPTGTTTPLGETCSYLVFVGVDGVLLRPSVRVPDSDSFVFSGFEFL
jgi:hypothetical protein